MILPFSEEEINTIKSFYNFKHIPKRYGNYIVPTDNKDVIDLIKGVSTKLGFIFMAYNFAVVDKYLCGLYNAVKLQKRKSIFINYRYLYPQLKSNKLKSERVLDWIVLYHKNIFIKNANVFRANTYANNLMSYLISTAYDEEKRLILSSSVPDINEFTYTCIGEDVEASQILNMLVKVDI